MANPETAKPAETPKLALRITMPSGGDAILLDQQGGTIDLQPVFYGGECASPIIQVVELHKDAAGKIVIDKVHSRSKLRLKDDGKLDLRRGEA